MFALAGFLLGHLLVPLRLLLAASLAVCACLPEPGLAQISLSPELRSQANALSKIPSFVEWPPQAFESLTAPFRLCVYGDFPFGTALSELTRSEPAHGHRIEIRWARKDTDLRGCQIVFISRSAQKSYAKILALLNGAATLTIGETRDFAKAGGMVEFVYENGVLAFEVNLASVESAHLRPSAQFLSLARRVFRTTESAKGQA